jgi:hypothetical protein
MSLARVAATSVMQMPRTRSQSIAPILGGSSHRGTPLRVLNTVFSRIANIALLPCGLLGANAVSGLWLPHITVANSACMILVGGLLGSS